MSRIIGGSRGGRRLTTPSGQATRPTSDRVREAVFSSIVSWLGTVAEAPEHTLRGYGFCDLYAGSGAVGLEAASRGADPVLCVERDRRTAGVIRRNATAVDLSVRVDAAKVEQLVTGPTPDPFTVVWLDPPYELDSAHLDSVLDDLVDHGWVVEDGLVVVERSVRSAPPTWPTGFDGGWTKNYGDTVVHYGCR